MLIRLFLIIFTFVELNCENFFDTVSNPNKNDDEYTATGARRWNKPRYYEKLYNIGKEIMSCADRPDLKNEGRMADMVALCEVENDTVLTALTKHSMLRSYGYEYLITDSPDERGINVALMYNPNAFKLINSRSIHVDLPNKSPTRDILYAKGIIINNDTLHVFVVHAPSRRGGEKASRNLRIAVSRTLVSTIDSLRSTFSVTTIPKPQNHIIVTGDFNDYGNVPALNIINNAGLIDLTKDITPFYKDYKCTGTYYFNYEWNMLDHIFISPTLSPYLTDAKINNNPKLLEENDIQEFIPKRSYRNYKYNHGFSDHLPLVAWFDFPL